jgi:hypothetical protein
MKIVLLRNLFALLALLLTIAPLSSCTDRKTEARAALEEHLKSFTPRSIEIDFFHENPSFPDKAYVSATVTYNYATADGTFQKEYLGYILKKEGKSWKVEQNSRYTKTPSEANTYLSGKKG